MTDQQRANETQQFENVSQQEHNVEQREDNVDQRDANEAIGPLIVALTREVRDLKETYRWARIVRAILATVFAVAVAATVFAVIDNRTQIRNLACYAVRLRPEGYSSTSDGIRSRYHCPPFDPSLNIPVVVPTVTKTAHGLPGPTRTVRPTATPVTATRTVSGPSIVVTRTRVVAHPSTRTVTATATRTCALICLPGG